MFLQVCVILFTGGVPDQVHPPGPGTPPGTRYTSLGPGTSPGTRYTPLGPGTPPPRPGTPPRTRYTPPRTRYPLGPATPPPGAKHAGRYGQRAGGTHPTGMQSCFIVVFLNILWQGQMAHLETTILKAVFSKWT